MAPPIVAVLKAKVLLIKLTVPPDVLAMAPPTPLIAVLLVRVEPITLTVPLLELRMPAPLPGLTRPPVIVRFVKRTLPGVVTSKIRTALWPLIDTLAFAGPLIFIAWLIVSELAGAITVVPVAKLISIAPQAVSAFASSIAARKVQTAPFVAHSPSPGFASLASPLLLTVNVVGHGSSF